MSSRIETIKYSEILKLNIKRPDIQRVIMKNKVKEIVKIQNEYYKDDKQFRLYGTIILCILNDEYYIIDGQHRYFAVKELYENYNHDLMVHLEIIEVKCKRSLKGIYEMINKNTNLVDFPYNFNKSLSENVFDYFQNNYKSVLISDRKPNRPNIYSNYFMESISKLSEILGTKYDKNMIIKLIENFNNECLKMNNHELASKIKGIKEDSNMLIKARKLGIILGLFKIKIEDNKHIYYWVYLIEENINPKIKEVKSKVKRKKIPTKLKNDIWDKNVGYDIVSACCICCKNTIIKNRDFDAGHIKSIKNGGLDTFDNLLPICRGCNCSMGSTNMDQYIKEYYPNNYEDFEGRNYEINIRKSVV